MPVGDFFGGAALLGVLLGAVGFATWNVVMRRLAHLDPLERGLAASVLGTAILLAVHVVPMMATVLARGSVLVLALALAAASTRIPRAGDSPADPPSRRGPRPESDRFSWIVAGAAIAYALASIAWQLKKYAGREIIGVDSGTFHLPNIARWIETGSLWQHDEFLPDFALGTYPHNGDVLLMSVIMPWHNDFLGRWAMAAFLVLLGVAVYGLARELRAPAAASATAAAVVVSIPIVGMSVIPRSLPDIVLYAMFALGALFLARHARTERRSDLVLAGTALGLAFGTKWYGVTSVPLLVAVWTAARLVARHRVVTVVRDSAIVTAFVLLAGGIWLVRNLVEVSNPFYPQRLEPLGIDLFAAPFDPLREQIGFSISNYATEPDVLEQLFYEVAQGLGGAPYVLLGGLVVALLAGGGRRIDRTVLVVIAAGLALYGLYVGTPYTAFGLEDDPALADVNTRYLVPGLIVAAAVTAWAVGRLPRPLAWAAQVALLLVVVTGARRAYDLVDAKHVVAITVGAGACAWGAWWLWRRLGDTRRRRIAFAGLAAFVAIVAVGQAYDSQKTVNDGTRYVGTDRAIDRLVRLAPKDKRIALAGAWTVDGQTPIYPAFGSRLENEVEYVGRFVGHTLRQFCEPRRVTPAETVGRPANDAQLRYCKPDLRAPFLAALNGGDFDLLVVGRGIEPPVRVDAEVWALQDGWRTVGLSRRLRLLAPPPGR